MTFLDTSRLGLKTLVVRTVKEFNADDMPTYASALAFSMVFSMFPFFLFLIALLGFLHLPQFFTWLRWPTVIVLMMLAVAVIYYVIPDMEQSFRFITPSSVLAVLVWIVTSLGFGVYVQNFANYNATYGSIGAIIALLLYLYISAAVLLLGAELYAVIEQVSREGKDVGNKPLNG